MKKRGRIKPNQYIGINNTYRGREEGQLILMLPIGMKIGFFDSGIGGLTVLKNVMKNFGNHQYFYLADNLNVPYGSKPISFLKENLEKIMYFYNLLHVDVLISACNTTDSIALKNNIALNNYDFVYVSIIKNGIKSIKKEDSVLLLGTENTIKLGVYKNLLFEKGIKKFDELACPLFVPLIEEGYWYGQMADSILRFYLRDFRAKYDKVLLGCTHYPILEEQIGRYTEALTIDPSDGIVDFLNKEIKVEKRVGSLSVNYYITGNIEKFKYLSKLFMKDISYLPNFKKIDLNKLYEKQSMLFTK